MDTIEFSRHVMYYSLSVGITILGISLSVDSFKRKDYIMTIVFPLIALTILGLIGQVI